MSRTDPEDRWQPDKLTNPTEIAWPGGITHIGLNVDIHRVFYGNVNGAQHDFPQQDIGYTADENGDFTYYELCWVGSPPRNDPPPPPPIVTGPYTGNWLIGFRFDEALVTSNSLGGYSPRTGWSATTGTILGASSITGMFPMEFSYGDWEWKGGTSIQPTAPTSRAPAFEYTFEDAGGAIIMDSEGKPVTDLGNGTGTPYRAGSSGTLVVKGWQISTSLCLRYPPDTGFPLSGPGVGRILGLLSEEAGLHPFNPLEFGETIESITIPLSGLSVRRTVGETVINFVQVGLIPNGQGCRVLLEKVETP